MNNRTQATKAITKGFLSAYGINLNEKPFTVITLDKVIDSKFNTMFTIVYIATNKCWYTKEDVLSTLIPSKEQRQKILNAWGDHTLPHIHNGTEYKHLTEKTIR